MEISDDKQTKILGGSNRLQTQPYDKEQAQQETVGCQTEPLEDKLLGNVFPEKHDDHLNRDKTRYNNIDGLPKGNQINKLVFRPQLRKIFKTEKVDRKSLVMMDVERAKRAPASKDKMT